MLDNVFPEFDWKGFGEHMGQNELSEDADPVYLVHLGVFSGQALRSVNIRSGSSGLSGASKDVLGWPGGCSDMTFRNVLRNTLVVLYIRLVY